MRAIFVFIFLGLIQFGVGASAQTCASLFELRAKTLFEFTGPAGLNLGDAEKVIRWQHHLVKLASPFYLASHANMEGAGATASKYFFANFQARAALIRELTDMKRGRNVNSPVTKSINYHLGLLDFDESMRLEYEAFLDAHGADLLKDVRTNEAFRRLDGRLLSQIHGAIGEVMTAVLVNPREVNQSVVDILGPKTLGKLGLDWKYGDIEIDLIVRRTPTDEKERWGEVKFSLSRSFLTTGRVQRIVEQADRVGQVRKAIERIGKVPPKQFIFLIHPHVTSDLVSPLLERGLEVVVIDPTTPIEAPTVPSDRRVK